MLVGLDRRLSCLRPTLTKLNEAGPKGIKQMWVSLSGHERGVFSVSVPFCSCPQRHWKFQPHSAVRLPRGGVGGVCGGGASAMNSAPPVHLLTSSWFPDEFHGHPSWLPIFQQHTLHVVFQWVSGKSSHCPSWFSSKFNNPPPPHIQGARW